MEYHAEGRIIKTNFKPVYFEDASSIEEVVSLHKHWQGQKVGILCPNCHEIFYLFENIKEDNFGKVSRIWGFCTHCSLNYERCLNVSIEGYI